VSERVSVLEQDKYEFEVVHKLLQGY